MPKNAPEKDVYSIIRLNEAHQKLLRCTAEDDLKGMKEVLKQKIDITYVPTLFSDGTRYKPATQKVDINVNYVQAFFRDGVRYEHTALIIALQRGCSEVINFLIEKGADLNQALSLAFLYFSEESSLQADLISKGADIEKAFKLAIGHDWNDEIQEKRGKAKILWQALVHQPDNLLLHIDLMLQGADINLTLCTVVFNEPENERMQFRLISMGANLNEALSMAVKTVHKEQLETVVSNLNSQGADFDKALSLALRHKQGNDELISKRASLNRVLSFAVQNHPDDDKLISTLISKGADANYVVDCEKDYRILHQAIDRGCSEKVIQCLLESGAKANEKMIVDRGGCEQIVFAMLTLSNPIGWFYLSYLFCVRGDCGNPFTKKRINAIDLARLNHNISAENIIVQYREKPKRVNEKTALLERRERTYGFFSSVDEKRDSKEEEVRINSLAYTHRT